MRYFCSVCSTPGRAVPRLFGATLTLLFLVLLAASGSAAQDAFTAAQAERGNALYQENCQSCHSSNMRGHGPFPPITGADFFANWGGRSVSELQQYVRENMPLGSAGSLNDQAYADIMAYWLSRHGYAAGGQPLPSDPGSAGGTPVENRRE